MTKEFYAWKKSLPLDNDSCIEWPSHQDTFMAGMNTRADLITPADGDAERALEAFNAFMSKEGRRELYKEDAVLASHAETIRAALHSTRKTPMLQDSAGWIRLLLPLAKGYVHANPGIRSTENIIEGAENCLASLDAVLSEGEP